MNTAHDYAQPTAVLSCSTYLGHLATRKLENAAVFSGHRDCTTHFSVVSGHNKLQWSMTTSSISDLKCCGLWPQ